jgi:hypothetical protein
MRIDMQERQRNHVMKLRSGLFACLALIAVPSLAIMWGMTEVPDPTDETKTCQVSQPKSYGGYIYQWPEKYDQVFWPYTDPKGIWYCEESGFISFIGDFDGMTKGELEKISDYLKRNNHQANDPVSKLSHLENVYSMREKGSRFHIQLLRVLAYRYEVLGYIEKANSYRSKALEGIEKELKGEIGALEEAGCLLVAANYHRQFGNIETSDAYLIKLDKVLEKITDPDSVKFSELIKTLSEKTPLITPGGRLCPDCGTDLLKKRRLVW